MASVCCMNGATTSSFTNHAPPPPPNPSADARFATRPEASLTKSDILQLPNNLDVFSIGPVAALKLLCGGIEALVKITGDIPPTPPTFIAPTNMLGMQEEKEKIIRNNSYKNLANLDTLHKRPPTLSSSDSDDIDGVNFRKFSAGISRAPTEPYIIIGDNAEPLNVQHSAITRKFFSKHLPLISLEDYLMRIHKFCPMSTAVYLATSSYIHKLAVDEKAIPVTQRNCHRLVLAGLRVAMKALEDQSYAHSRFSKVGGVSSGELARLEISFCFLTNFELKTSKEVLFNHVVSLKDISSLQDTVTFTPQMPAKVNKRSNIGVQEVTADAENLEIVLVSYS